MVRLSARAVLKLMTRSNLQRHLHRFASFIGRSPSARRKQQRRAQEYIFTGAPTARQPEWPTFMYLASNPASRSAIAVLQPTWKP